MKLPLRPFLLLPLLAGCAVMAEETPGGQPWEPEHFNLIPRALQAHPYMDVMIVTEFTPRGKSQPLAGPDHPVYYTGSDGGLMTVGEAIGGEIPPPASELAQILVRALAVNHILAADKAHPPQIYVHYKWGSFNRLPPLGGPPDFLDRMNLIERAALVGGTHFAMQMAEAMNAGTLGFFENNPRNAFLAEEAHRDLYFLIAEAYDFSAALQGRVVPLWRTMISTNSRGITMEESLPQMVAVAAPYLGHPTLGPVRLSRPTVKNGHVEIGEPTVREYLPPEQ